MARIIDGRAAADHIRAAVAREIRPRSGEPYRTPGLATVLVGDDPASPVYIASKRRACAEVGIRSIHHHLPRDVRRSEVIALIDELNADPAISGILCQLPLPEHLDPREITNRIDPGKDVDGLTTVNAGRLALGLPGLRPCTPEGVMELLAHAGVDLRGAHAVIVGCSNLVGKPTAQLLLAAGATVVMCHRQTRNLHAICRQADVLVVAAGHAGLVQGHWVKPGAVVIDVGINRTDEGLVGDVDFEAARAVAAAITPVPGGVGPMTIACLLRNTLRAANAERAAA
jgi:methylenetetrahydrofolate dehydrogenase (NADP+) / methenyltetrahydrofolate cyclohydrolase